MSGSGTAPAPFDRDALIWFATYQQRRSRDLMAHAIARLPTSAWTDAAPALNRLFYLDHDDHFLRAPPSLLDRQHEPQITRAFRNFLCAGDDLLARTQAVFDAVLGADHVRLVTADAPMADEGKDRIDLFVRGRTGEGRRCGLAIEAKFGHYLTGRQLADYRRKALRHLTGDHEPLLFLVVIASMLRPGDASLIEKDRRTGREPSWRFMDWRTFLLNL